MAGKFVPISGPVVANTFYASGVLVARDVGVTLPAVTPVTADLPVMGTYTKPIWQLIEHMEAAITKIGFDKGLKGMLSPGVKSFEARWVQTVTDANGRTRNVGCKAFLTGEVALLPEIGQEVGSAGEHEVRIGLTRYNLFVDGEEMWLIDRMAGKVRINGVEYADMDSML